MFVSNFLFDNDRLCLFVVLTGRIFVTFALMIQIMKCQITQHICQKCCSCRCNMYYLCYLSFSICILILLRSSPRQVWPAYGPVLLRLFHLCAAFAEAVLE